MPAAPLRSFVQADLHTHTLHSDGMLTPTALVERAQARGLAALAVTDHDTVSGVAEAQAAGARLGVDVLTGVELSAEAGGREVHLLGYAFDPTEAALQTHLARVRQDREQRAEAIIERLRTQGLSLTMDDVRRQADGAAIGRPHVAAVLVEQGAVATRSEAFDHYLGFHGTAFVTKTLIPAAEAIALVHAAGGLTVLAHPGHWTPGLVIQSLIRDGLDGLEIIHPSHDASLTAYYRQLARDFGLVATGGSDYHGFRPGDEENLGRYGLPLAALERLHAAIS